METRRFAPLLITLFAALAMFYPVTSATHSTVTNSTRDEVIARTKNPPGTAEPASPEFPTAQALITEFLANDAAVAHEPAAHSADAPYSIQFLVATVPDPVSSRLPHFFDSFIESIESAAEACDYSLDRFALPWLEKGSLAHEDAPAWRQRLFESTPGLILFRNPKDHRLLLIFLVGETPTTGIHKTAMLAALEQMAPFYPWDTRHAQLPEAFPQVADAGEALRIMGPSFSGSGVSLRFALDNWSRLHPDVPNLRFEMISGTATAIDAKWLGSAGRGNSSFQATVPADLETLQSVACYIGGLGYKKIAILTESNTAYGQNASSEAAPGKGTVAQREDRCGNGQTVPEILSVPFPLDISRLRIAANSMTPEQAPSESSKSEPKPKLKHLSQQGGANPREVIPSFSELSVQSAELTLSNLLSTISREQYKYVGIVATDVRDATFLAREVREHCPTTVLFTLNSDLLYAYPDVNNDTKGMIIVTPYPLFNLEQLWTYAYGGSRTRLQFSNQAAEGVYNATLALLHEDGKLVDYGTPLAAANSAPALKIHKPALWLTAIGNGESLPIKLLDWRDDGKYTYTPVTTGPSVKRSGGRTGVGRGVFAENSVVAVIALSLLVMALAGVIISHYWRPERRGTGGISAIFGDPASIAYWSECRLFLLCSCMSLLSFYVVLVAAFCLPYVAGRAAGRSLQTTVPPDIAAIGGLVTVVVLLVAAHVLISALRKAPSNQRGTAPEVIFVTLGGCAFVFILAGALGVNWLGSVGIWPASGLFIHLRSFDFRGGLSPLLPLLCVAMGAVFWALCSFRRLRLLDVLRATATPDKPHAWLSFLSMEAPSFNGVRELENSAKHILESSSVISLRWYFVLLILGISIGHYFFATRLVRALEPAPFYWLFEGAFIIVYWALLMEFLRLVFAWRSLHLLLRRLSWHPLLGAFKRYRGCRPNQAKMDLTHPPSSFAALECSVDQAGRLLRNATGLSTATETAVDLRDSLSKLIPVWESQVESARAHLAEALKMEWSDDSRSSLPMHLEGGPKKRATRIQGNWRESLKSRSRAQHALFRILQSMGKLMESYWSFDQQGAPAHKDPAAKEFFEQAEEFIVGRTVNFLAVVFPIIQNLGYFVLAGLLLMLLAVTSYPFQPRNEFLFFNWIVILCFMGTVFWIFVQMERDTILSLLNDTIPGQVNFNRELILRTLLYVAVPLMALLGAQFPESLRQVLSLFTAAQGGQ